MPPWKPSSRANRMMLHYHLRGRAYPTPPYWDRLYQMLVEEAERRGQTPPPAPLVFDVEREITDEDKTQRLREQVAWADRNNLLHRVQMFFEAMPASGWQRSED